MAQNIPIWPGSASFTTGSTPFGLYDADTVFVTASNNTAEWCAKRLGYPITDIELQDINFFACFEEAVTEYGAQVNTYNIRDNMLNLYGSSTGSNLTQQKISSNMGGLIELATEYGVEAGSGGNVTYYTGSIEMNSKQQIYDLTNSSLVTLESGTAGTTEIEIKRIFHEAPPAIVKYFDPFVGTGLGSQNMLEGFGWGNYSDFSNVPYKDITYSLINAVGVQWIRRYTLALTKEMLGYVRGKYSGIPIPNAEVTLNGSDLISAGQTEKEGLITELKEILDTMSRQAQLERKQAEADSMQQQMNKIPLKIYIG